MALWLKSFVNAGLFCLLAAVDGSAQASAPVLSSNNLNFGSQFVGIASAAQTVTVTNTGYFAVSQSSFVTGGTNAADFALTTDCGITIAPGGQCSLRVTFAPSVLGSESAFVAFTNRDFLGNPYPQQIVLAGSGTPAAAPNTGSLSLTSLFSGGPSSIQTITVNNSGSDAQNQGSFLLTGPNASDFILQTTCGTTFSAGGTCSVVVLFTPIGAANESATLTFTDSDAATGIPYTQWIALRGAVSPGVASGVFEIINKHSGKALDVLDGSLANGAPVEQFDFLAKSNQRWQLLAVDDGYYKVQNVASGKVLDVVAASNENGAGVQQWDYLGTDNQKWQLTQTADGSFEIANKASGKLLDVTGLSTQNGTTMQQWAATGGDNQKWVITPQQYFTVTSVHSQKVLDVTDYSLQDGALIQQWQSLGGDNQRWDFVPLGNGYFEILNKLSGMALDATDPVVGASVGDGALVQQYAYAGRDNQQWQLVPTGGGYYKIVNKAGGKVLDVVGVSTSNGGGIQVYTYLAEPNQQWQLDLVQH